MPKSPEGGKTAVEPGPLDWIAVAYFNNVDRQSRGFLLKWAKEGRPITIPTTTLGEINMTGEAFLKAVGHD